VRDKLVAARLQGANCRNVHEHRLWHAEGPLVRVVRRFTAKLTCVETMDTTEVTSIA